MLSRALYATLLALAHGCYWNTPCTYRYYGSKTVYDDVRGDIRDVPRLTDCEPVSVWALMRHGTRQPSSGNVPNIVRASRLKDDVLRSHKEGKGELCAQDITNLQDWQLYKVEEATATYLTEAGYQQLFDLGSRFHEHFRPLLKDLDNYRFKPTMEQRTIQSAKAFVEGLEQGIFTFEQTNATETDDVIRPYADCDTHYEEVYHGPRSKKELKKYYKTEEFKKLLENVQHRAGLEEPLLSKNVSGLYDLCRYFRAYSSNRTSPWCALFNDHELEIMEYINDLKHYYRNGYGSPINSKLGMLTLKDLLENFRRDVQESTKSFTGYFSHDTMLDMMYSALGLFRDEADITGMERMPTRKWRSSFLTPFAANFAAVLHKCSPENSTSSYQVQFLMNEKEVELCGARTCSWSQFLEKFEPFLDSNMDFCKLTDDLMPLKSMNTTEIDGENM